MTERALAVDIRGERLLLHAHRAVIWPARATVLIADLHLGKSEFFRRSGLAAPEGSSAQDLQRLGELIEEHSARRVVLLGDFVHAAFQQRGDHEDTFASWRDRYGSVQIVVIAGNHDRRAAGRVLTSAVDWAGAEVIEGPFVLRHHPARTMEGYTLCGHIHPVVQLYGMRRERTRMPVFWRQEQCLVLPSFGEFTGGAEVEPGVNDRLYAVAGGEVWALPRRESR